MEIKACKTCLWCKERQNCSVNPSYYYYCDNPHVLEKLPVGYDVINGEVYRVKILCVEARRKYCGDIESRYWEAKY